MQIDAETRPTTPMSVIIRPLGGLENPKKQSPYF